MRFFECCFAQQPQPPTTYITQEQFSEVTEQNRIAICEMYRESLYKSYLALYQADKKSFAEDILEFKATANNAIDYYSERIARLTIKEWKENKLTSVIAFETKDSIRSIVGFALFGEDNEIKSTKKDEKHFYLHYIGVTPSNFKQGIGSQLLSKAIEHCRKTAIQAGRTFHIKLHTRKFNVPAINLYKKIGFTMQDNDFTHGHNENYICFSMTQPMPRLKTDQIEIRQYIKENHSPRCAL